MRTMNHANQNLGYRLGHQERSIVVGMEAVREVSPRFPRFFSWRPAIAKCLTDGGRLHGLPRSTRQRRPQDSAPLGRSARLATCGLSGTWIA